MNQPQRFALTLSRPVLVLACVLGLQGCGPRDESPAPSAEQGPRPGAFGPASHTYALVGPLVPKETTMVTAWDIPSNPLSDPTLDGSAEGELVRRGFRLFTNTPAEAPHYTPSKMSCSNCHLNVGQRELALPLVGSAGMFPEYNNRAGRLFSLEDRIVGCFWRSENAVRGPDNGGLAPEASLDPADDEVPHRAGSVEGNAALPDTESEEVVALAAFLRWLSGGFSPGEDPPFRKQNRIASERLLPVEKLEPSKGEQLYQEWCVNCHGPDGQGVQVGDKIPGPLWGPHSWNDGAGLARFYTLAGFIRYAMPYLAPGSLSDEEAQHLAAFIISKPRPAYPYKSEDYQVEPLPADAAFYRRGE